MGVPFKTLKRAWFRDSVHPVRSSRASVVLPDHASMDAVLEAGLEPLRSDVSERGRPQTRENSGREGMTLTSTTVAPSLMTAVDRTRRAVEVESPLTYKHRLVEKQRIKAYLGGISDTRFKKWSQAYSYSEFVTHTQSTLVQMLVLMGWASSPAESRQWIRHGRVCVNGRILALAHYPVQPGDCLEPTEWLKTLLATRAQARLELAQKALALGTNRERGKGFKDSGSKETGSSPSPENKDGSAEKARGERLLRKGGHWHVRLSVEGPDTLRRASPDLIDRVRGLPEASPSAMEMRARGAEGRCLGAGWATSGPFWETDAQTGATVIVDVPRSAPYSEMAYRAAQEFYR